MKNQSNNILSKEFWKERKYALWALFLPIYLACFFLIEAYIDGSSDYWVSYLPIDDEIPFIEWFIIPYYLWYPLLVGVGLYGLFNEEWPFRRYMTLLAVTFFSSLIFFVLFPNGQNLRPDHFEHANFCVDMIKAIYEADTNTNVFPSIHVVGAFVAWIGVLDFKTLKHKKAWGVATGILAVLISISTVFVKQHSVLDIIGGIVFTIVGFVIVYFILDKYYFAKLRNEKINDKNYKQ